MHRHRIKRVERRDGAPVSSAHIVNRVLDQEPCATPCRPRRSWRREGAAAGAGDRCGPHDRRRRAQRAARPWRCRLPDGCQVADRRPCRNVGSADAGRRQRRRGRAGIVQGPRAAAAQPVPRARGRPHRGGRRRCPRRRRGDEGPRSSTSRPGSSRRSARWSRRAGATGSTVAVVRGTRAPTCSARRPRCSRSSKVVNRSRASHRRTAAASTRRRPDRPAPRRRPSSSPAPAAPTSHRHWSTTSRRSPTSPGSSPTARRGSEGWGLRESPGTIVCTVTGHTRRHGVAEVPMGTPLTAIIDEIGGGAREGRTLVAAISGVANAFVPAAQFDTPAAYEEMAGIGAGLGAGRLHRPRRRGRSRRRGARRRPVPRRGVVRSVRTVQARRAGHRRPPRRHPQLEGDRRRPRGRARQGRHGRSRRPLRARPAAAARRHERTRRCSRTASTATSPATSPPPPAI